MTQRRSQLPRSPLLLLDELERVTAAERDAMLSHNWQVLSSCVELKEYLATELANHGDLRQTPLPQGNQLHRLRRATEHNAKLAQNLSGQLAHLAQQRRPTTTYNRGAKLTNPRVSRMVRMRG